MGALGEILAALAVKVLQWWASREDIKRGERQRLLIDQLGLKRAALEWTALALRDPARAAELRVQHPDLVLSGFVPDPPAGPPGPAPKGHV